MAKVKDLYNFINDIAPFQSAMDFDNVGILVGDSNKIVKTVMLALDITKDVVFEAVELNADAIISHHPVIFKPLRYINSTDIPYLLAKNDISAICAHTNLDLADYGVNYYLAQSLALKDLTRMSQFGLIGTLSKPFSTRNFAKYVKDCLVANGVRYTDIEKKIIKVAVCSGSGGDLVDEAFSLGADVLVTGEIKHSQMLRANDLGLAIVDAGHFKTEDVVIQPLTERLQRKFKNTFFIKSKTCSDKVYYV